MIFSARGAENEAAEAVGRTNRYCGEWKIDRSTAGDCHALFPNEGRGGLFSFGNATCCKKNREISGKTLSLCCERPYAARSGCSVPDLIIRMPGRVLLCPFGYLPKTGTPVKTCEPGNGRAIVVYCAPIPGATIFCEFFRVLRCNPHLGIAQFANHCLFFRFRLPFHFVDGFGVDLSW
ncbi:MAG: hypothetical protein V3S29_12755 [bacterium]